MEDRKKILVLDGGNQNTLAIVRHLGLAGLEVHVVSYNNLSPASFSKYTAKKFVVPAPKNADRFYSSLISILSNENYLLLMPVGYASFKVCMERQEEIRKYTKVVLTNNNAFEIASSKKRTYEFAEENGILCPKTWKISSAEDLAKADITFPLVIKAPFEMGKNVVAYANSREEAVQKFSSMCRQHGFSAPNLPVVQEYVRGEGYGFFAYYENGECKQTFMHRRIRENPPSGGVSTCAESFFDPGLLEQGKKMLDLLKWNGVAMVEFKKDIKDGKYKLMEVNPKFWGSLELAIVSGVNFPLALVRQAEGKAVERIEKFKEVRFQWMINGELFHFFSRPSALFRILNDTLRSHKDFWWKDIVPNLVQVLLVFNYYYKKLIEG